MSGARRGRGGRGGRGRRCLLPGTLEEAAGFERNIPWPQMVGNTGQIGGINNRGKQGRQIYYSSFLTWYAVRIALFKLDAFSGQLVVLS